MPSFHHNFSITLPEIERIVFICRSRMVNIVNFGENIHQQLRTSRYFKHFLLTFWEKWIEQLRSTGIFNHVYIDSSFKHLLPLLTDAPHDGLVAQSPNSRGMSPSKKSKSISATKSCWMACPRYSS